MNSGIDGAVLGLAVLLAFLETWFGDEMVLGYRKYASQVFGYACSAAWFFRRLDRDHKNECRDLGDHGISKFGSSLVQEQACTMLIISNDCMQKYIPGPASLGRVHS